MGKPSFVSEGLEVLKSVPTDRPREILTNVLTCFLFFNCTLTPQQEILAVQILAPEKHPRQAAGQAADTET